MECGHALEGALCIAEPDFDDLAEEPFALRSESIAIGLEVLNAVGSDLWPEVPGLTVAAISGAIGLSAGLVAKHREVWL